MRSEHCCRPSATFRPTLTKKGYWTNPGFNELLMKSQAELEKLAHFSIANEHGSIEFLEEVDLTYSNLDEIVIIRRNYVRIMNITLKRFL